MIGNLKTSNLEVTLILKVNEVMPISEFCRTSSLQRYNEV